MSKLSTFLVHERDARGWSRQDLADKSGIPYPTIARWENPKARAKPDHENVQALARAFEMPTHRVLALLGYPIRESNDNDDRAKRWEAMRKLLESDPRAERIFELFDEADDEERDIGLTILEAHFSRRRRRR